MTYPRTSSEAREPKCLAFGQRVRVRGGLLTGLHGSVVARSEHRLLITLDIRYEGIRVEIDRTSVEPG